MKIVSLLPNATEIVFALGAGHLLVGRSHECDYPESVSALPVCTNAKVLPEGPSKQIDANVQNLVQQGLSVYEVKGEQLQELQPDLIITQMQCELCAASPKDVHEAVSAYLDYEPEVLALSPNNLADVWEDIKRIGQAIGREGLSQTLVQQIQAQIRNIHQEAITNGAKPETVLIEWMDPLMYAGNWMPRLVEEAGGKHLYTAEGEHSPMKAMQTLADADPDKIIITPCGFDMKQTVEELPVLENWEQWNSLKAVQANEVYIADGHQYFNRPGPRLLDSVKMLAEMLHKYHFSFGYQNAGWLSIKDVREAYPLKA